MGRKPTASKIIIDKPENPSLERVEPKPSNANVKLPGAMNSHLENSNPVGSPLKIPTPTPNPSVDGVATQNERSPEPEHVNQEYRLHKKSSQYQRKNSKSVGTSVRRSERIKSGVVRTYDNSNARRGGGPEYIEFESENEKDEPVNQMEVEQVLSEPEPVLEPGLAENSGEKRSDENNGSAIQRIEALEKITELLKSKVDEITGSYGSPSMSPIRYQSLYIDSQKKNEALSAKLENALAKIELYEKERHVFHDVLDKMKDSVNAVMVSNLAKATEAAVNASSQAMRQARTASAAKRKRNAQEK